MKRNKFVITIVLIALLSAMFGAGGAKPALAEAVTLGDVAGLTAWYNAGAAIIPTDFLSGFSTVEYQATDLVVGTVDIPVYVDEYNPLVLVHSSGYILAFYPQGDTAAKMIDVMAKTLNTTLLEYAVVMVGAAGGIVVPDVTYYNFGNPAATDILVLAENRADGENAFSLQMPANVIDVDGDETDTSIYYDYVYYDKSYSFYQTYLPEFTLDTENLEEPVNFVLDNADFIAPGYYGTIFGHFYADPDPLVNPVITDLDPEALNAFTVNSGSTSAFGALALTYAYTLEGTPAIVGADLVAEFTLAAPGTMGGTAFDTLPSAITKISPLDEATGLSLNPTLDWSDSTAPNYEYCIDTINNDACDIAWVSTPTGINTATLSGLLFDTTYYWQVRAANSAGVVEADDDVWFSFTTEVITAPAAFTKVSPLVATTGLSPNGVVLDWNPTYGAYSYEYCVTEASSCNDADWVKVGTDTTATVTNLKFETNYKWQVRAVNATYTTYADGGTLWTFTTLDTFSKLLPANNAINQKTRLTLTWEKLGASTYEYCIDQTAPGTAPVELNDCGTGWVSTDSATKVTLRLSYAITYYWQVRASNGTTTIYANDDNDPATPDWWSFKTAAKNTPSTNVQFEKISPQDGATDVFTAVTLKWVNIGAIQYEYCYDTVDDNLCTWVDAKTATSVTISSLTYGTTYYWQVRANIGTVALPNIIYADKGAFWDFTTTFNKLTPENHSQDQDVNSLKLSWETVTGAVGYQYCLVTAESCVETDYVGAAGTSDTVNGLSYGTRYYWQVRANIGSTAVPVWLYANGASTALWRFTTEDLEKISPENGALDQPINITLDWGEVEDAIAYEYCLYSDIICTEWASTAAVSTATITKLSYSTTYYWQVRANVGAMDAEVWLYADGLETAFWSFTTIAEPVVVP